MKYDQFKRHMENMRGTKLRSESGPNDSIIDYWMTNGSIIVATRYTGGNVDWFYLEEPDEFGDYSPYYEEMELRYG